MDNNTIYSTNGQSRGYATYRRQLLRWLVPDVGYIQMYVNPQSININRAKAIKSERTKGGFVIQYWGEELTDITITGTTATSGVEGLNILHDIYRSEQIGFNTSALNAEAIYENETVQSWIDTVFPSIGDALDFFKDFGDNGLNTPYAQAKPTLAYMASSVEMHYMGSSFKGFFTGFTCTESADQAGWFNYDLKFKAFLERGRRSNFMPWHRSPTVTNQTMNSSVPWELNMSYYNLR